VCRRQTRDKLRLVVRQRILELERHVWYQEVRVHIPCKKTTYNALLEVYYTERRLAVAHIGHALLRGWLQDVALVYGQVLPKSSPEYRCRQAYYSRVRGNRL
jgi:hypothetical protein